MASSLFSKFLPHLYTNSNGRVFLKALELLFLSAGIISSFVIVKGYSCEIIFTTQLISFCSSIKCFLSSPLYICIIINFMILLIALISSFQHHQDTTDFVVDDDDDQVINMIKVEEDGHGMQVHVSSSLLRLPSLQSTEDVSQTPSDDTNEVKNTIHLVCSENEESSSKAESEPADDYYTMEATWNAITGGEKESPKRKTSQLKKCETWNTTAREVNDTSRSTGNDQCLELEETLLFPIQSKSSSSKELRKSETFNDSVTLARRSGGFIIRRDPSMSLEEFNKQVEAFIKRFNDDMRLQRQESDQRFLDMISRGI